MAIEFITSGITALSIICMDVSMLGYARENKNTSLGRNSITYVIILTLISFLFFLRPLFTVGPPIIQFLLITSSILLTFLIGNNYVHFKELMNIETNLMNRAWIGIPGGMTIYVYVSDITINFAEAVALIIAMSFLLTSNYGIRSFSKIRMFQKRSDQNLWRSIHLVALIVCFGFLAASAVFNAGGSALVVDILGWGLILSNLIMFFVFIIIKNRTNISEEA